MQELLGIVVGENLYAQVEPTAELLVEQWHHHQGDVFVRHMMDQGMFEGMAVGSVAQIVQEYGAIEGFGFLFGNIDLFLSEGLYGLLHQVHGAQGMVETRVGGAGVYQFRHAELLDAPESLHIWVFEQIVDQFAWDGDETVDGVVDDFRGQIYWLVG